MRSKDPVPTNLHLIQIQKVHGPTEDLTSKDKEYDEYGTLLEEMVTFSHLQYLQSISFLYPIILLYSAQDLTHTLLAVP